MIYVSNECYGGHPRVPLTTVRECIPGRCAPSSPALPRHFLLSALSLRTLSLSPSPFPPLFSRNSLPIWPSLCSNIRPSTSISTSSRPSSPSASPPAALRLSSSRFGTRERMFSEGGGKGTKERNSGGSGRRAENSCAGWGGRGGEVAPLPFGPFYFLAFPTCCTPCRSCPPSASPPSSVLFALLSLSVIILAITALATNG